MSGSVVRRYCDETGERCIPMSRLVLTLAVDYATPGKAIGIKEAIAMDLEKYGDVRVLRVDVREPEQLSMGLAPNTKGETP